MRELMSTLQTVSILATLALSLGCDRGATSQRAGPAPEAPGGGAGGPAADSKSPASAPKMEKEKEEKEEPRYVTVQHILIGFRGSVPGKNITRSKEEAAKLAEDLLRRAKAGEDFDALVREYTDDAHPGIYSMSNHGVPPPQGGYARGGMVPAFGDVGFPLEVGGVGLAAYDSTKSPYGWHVIKRTK